MFELGCHIIDSAVYVLGKPTKVTAHLRKTKAEQDNLADNCLAVLEYPKATATIRSALVEYDGFKRRQFVVCGDQGTVDIRPMEPPKMLLALSKARDGFKKGYQEVALTRSVGRYDGEFIDLAKIIRGEKQPDFSAAHDLAVHETILRASGMPVN
jgi:predicted dehydrogenase